MVLLGDKGVATVGIMGAAAPARVGGAADDYGDGMQCPDHPYRPNAGSAGGGGVCAFCLQEKLGKLVSSSSSKYSFSPLPSSLFYDKDGEEVSSSESPRSAASFRYSSASAANGAGDGGKGKKGGSYSYSLFGGRRRRHGRKESRGEEESKHGAAGAAKHSNSSKILMIPFFHASSRSNGHHGSKTAQKVTNPPTAPPVYANRNGIPQPSIATAASNHIIGSGGSNGLSVFTRSRSATTRPVVPEGVAAPPAIQTSTSSSTTPRLKGGDLAAADSPRNRRFWSFLHLQPSRPSASCTNNQQTTAADGEAPPCPPLPPKNHQSQIQPPAQAPTISSNGGGKPPSIHPDPIPAPARIGTTKPPTTAVATTTWNDDGDQSVAGDTSQASATSASPFDRKVERSRSVGCGSRSFSGDFLERISTGLGDCALRRVESHREPAGKLGNKIVLHRLSISTATAVDDDDENSDCRRRRSARCGGIFGGMIPSSFYTSSSAAASSYWPPPQDEVGSKSGNGGSNSNSNRGTPRAKGGWGWAFASPMRAFRTSSSVGGNGSSSNHSHKYTAFHGPEADAGRRSMSVAGGVGYGAGVRAPSYPYMNGG